MGFEMHLTKLPMEYLSVIHSGGIAEKPIQNEDVFAWLHSRNHVDLIKHIE